MVRGADESLEDWPEFARAPEVLRMPLHAQAEGDARILNRLDDAIGRRG